MMLGIEVINSSVLERFIIVFRFMFVLIMIKFRKISLKRLVVSLFGLSRYCIVWVL